MGADPRTAKNPHACGLRCPGAQILDHMGCYLPLVCSRSPTRRSALVRWGYRNADCATGACELEATSCRGRARCRLQGRQRVGPSGLAVWPRATGSSGALAGHLRRRRVFHAGLLADVDSLDVVAELNWNAVGVEAVDRMYEAVVYPHRQAGAISRRRYSLPGRSSRS
jgi:hypothetical protein